MRWALVIAALLALAACEGRYGTTDSASLAVRLERDFGNGGSLAAMVAALEAEGYQPRPPVTSAGDIPPDCWSRRVTGALQLAGSRVIYVCASADPSGAVTRIVVDSYRNNF